jgi:hypothetical protein
MSNYKYILEPYKGMNSRYPCPSCKQREFTRYIDTETAQYVNTKVGRCNRQDSCGYHYTPKQYFIDKNISFSETHLSNRNCQPKAVTLQRRAVYLIDVEVFKDSLANYQQNHFVRFLLDLFGVEVTQKLIARYFIGTSTHWEGATIFWQIDIKGRARTGKIMLYDPATGKRVKEPYDKITWVHKALKLPDFGLKQVFFGEHLLRDNTKPVAMVESEKTACIASVYFPGMIWLATGSLNNLKADKCAVLAGRKIILYPDLGAFKKWSQQAKALPHFATFTVSNLLEQTATEAERQQGLDLADYLTKFDHSEPVKSESLDEHPVDIYHIGANQLQNNSTESSWNTIAEDRSQQSPWECEIIELERFFTAVHLPTNPIQLRSGVTVIDIRKCIESNLLYIKAHNGNRTYLPYLEQLRQLKQILLNKMN